MPAPKAELSSRLNLSVLRRHDPSIVEIVDSTSYVALYQHTTEWHKTGVEGTLFLFKRSRHPLYGFFILNRQGIENVCEDLSDGANLEVTPELIIYQAPSSSGFFLFVVVCVFFNSLARYQVACMVSGSLKRIIARGSGLGCRSKFYSLHSFILRNLGP
jgi:hypothetical protein